MYKSFNTVRLLGIYIYKYNVKSTKFSSIKIYKDLNITMIWK